MSLSVASPVPLPSGNVAVRYAPLFNKCLTPSVILPTPLCHFCLFAFFFSIFSPLECHISVSPFVIFLTFLSLLSV